ncbi:MAG: Stp1/IreP family PP2C-type Ser/Thr phosphatase [Polyangia bacterium]
MRLLSYSLSDVGRKRDHNEDNFLIDESLTLYAVADGMGGHAAGERASKLALEMLSAAVGDPTRERADPLQALREATQAAGASIFVAAQRDPDLHGMGTTLTSLWFQRGRAYLAHVGDSRAYLYRDGRVQQLSDDHSWVSEQVRAGMMTEEEAKESKFRHIITRSVGFEHDVQVDGAAIPVQAGDCFVLCSDGLSNYVEGEELARVLAARFYSEVPRFLVDLANDRGGDDNVTVVVVHLANDADRDPVNPSEDASADAPAETTEELEPLPA